MRARCRRAFTLVEIAVVLAIFSLVLYIIVGGMHLARTYFLAGQLSHALQGGLVLGAALEDDLRQLVRDPTSRQVFVASTDPSPSLAFYRGGALTDEGTVALLPTRWTVVQDSTGGAAHLVRTAWNDETGQWDTHAYPWAPIAMPSPDNPAIGFRVVGDADSDVQTVVLTVLARTQPQPGAPGAANDRASVQIAVCVPRLPHLGQPLFRIAKKLAEVPKP